VVWSNDNATGVVATQAGYEHRTVNHGAGEYARHDPDVACVHCTRWKVFGPV
jgi:hypothetical protein